MQNKFLQTSLYTLGLLCVLAVSPPSLKAMLTVDTPDEHQPRGGVALRMDWEPGPWRGIKWWPESFQPKTTFRIHRYGVEGTGYNHEVFEWPISFFLDRKGWLTLTYHKDGHCHDVTDIAKYTLRLDMVAKLAELPSDTSLSHVLSNLNLKPCQSEGSYRLVATWVGAESDKKDTKTIRD